jgi:hypothetical protein
MEEEGSILLSKKLMERGSHRGDRERIRLAAEEEVSLAETAGSRSFAGEDLLGAGDIFAPSAAGGEQHETDYLPKLWSRVSGKRDAQGRRVFILGQDIGVFGGFSNRPRAIGGIRRVWTCGRHPYFETAMVGSCIGPP